MRFSAFAFLILACLAPLSSRGQEPLPESPAPPADTKPADPGSPDQDFRQKVSYVLGMNFGNNLRQNEIVCDLTSLMAGISDALKGAPPKYSDEELDPVMQRFQQEMQQKARARTAAVAAKNKQEETTFLAENRSKQGVQVTPSGLQYRVIQRGEGAAPTADDTVRCHYRGTLLDGTEFDSSYRRGEPAEFQVNGVISGWTEALQLMHVGDKWQLFIPSNLAYKEEGYDTIPPNAMLVFELELLDVVK